MISVDALSMFHFLGVFGLSLIASGIVLNAFAGLLLLLAKKQSYEYLSPQARLTILHALSIAPIIIAGFSTALVALLAANPSWAQGFIHWHHLPGKLDWHSYCGLTFTVFIVIFTAYRILTWRQAQRHFHDLACNQDSAHQSSVHPASVDQQRFDQSPHTPLAYSYGAFPTKSVISPYLATKLNKAELEIVSQHELSHCEYNDPIKLFVFFGLCQCFYFPLRNTLLQQYRTAMEERADQNTVAAGHDSFLVAETLLKVARCQKQQSGIGVAGCAFSNELIEQRIHALTLNHTEQPRYFISVIITLCSLSGALILSIDSIHHLSESLLFHFFN